MLLLDQQNLMGESTVTSRLLLQFCWKLIILMSCRFLANGWPITTTGNQGLGVQIKQLIESSAVSMGTAASAKLAAGLLDTWAAIQLVPIPASSSGSSSSFGDTPESSTTTPSTPEEANPFSSSSATQSQDFENAGVTGTNNVSSPSPVSASDQLIATAIQQTAAVSLNTTVNTTKPMFGNTQAVVFTSSGDAVAPATSALNTSLGTAHIEAPSGAPKALVACAAGRNKECGFRQEGNIVDQYLLASQAVVVAVV